MITNKTNLPQSVVNLANFAGYEGKGDISVTRIIKPPRIVALYKRHQDEISIDAQDLAWSILGQSVHVMLERSASEEVIAEKRLHTQIFGWDVNGQPDLYYPKELRIDDYKVTSVWAFMLTAKFEWEAQLNLNAMLHRLHGQEVEQLNIVAILRDWQMTKALVDLRYPQHQIHVVGQPVWDNDKCIDYAEERVALHQDAQELPDDQLPLCTPAERWYRPGGVRVVKNGNKKADKVLPTVEKAKEYIALETPKLKPGRYFLEPVETPGENIRCLHYCEARSFCAFAKSLAPVAPSEEESE
jgi:hypothetical protein